MDSCSFTSHGRPQTAGAFFVAKTAALERPSISMPASAARGVDGEYRLHTARRRVCKHSVHPYPVGHFTPEVAARDPAAEWKFVITYVRCVCPAPFLSRSLLPPPHTTRVEKCRGGTVNVSRRLGACVWCLKCCHHPATGGRDDDCPAAIAVRGGEECPVRPCWAGGIVGTRWMHPIWNAQLAVVEDDDSFQSWLHLHGGQAYCSRCFAVCITLRGDARAARTSARERADDWPGFFSLQILSSN